MESKRYMLIVPCEEKDRDRVIDKIFRVLEQNKYKATDVNGEELYIEPIDNVLGGCGAIALFEENGALCIEGFLYKANIFTKKVKFNKEIQLENMLIWGPKKLNHKNFMNCLVKSAMRELE